MALGILKHLLGIVFLSLLEKHNENLSIKAFLNNLAFFEGCFE